MRLFHSGLAGAALLAGLVTISGCASAPVAASAPAMESKQAQTETFDQDRQAILAMVGDFKVSFDFTETVSFDERYTLKKPYITGGDEIVRVIEDRGDFISLQHILVVGDEEEKFPVKHWRQDWAYEPESVLVFVGGNAWRKRTLNAEEARGKWAQTVYQVDDAPRYGALGAWSHADGVSQWTPPMEWRPLPRRDATKRDDYDAINAVNRHVITPAGWAHEQDNTKLILKGDQRALVREIGVNTYARSDDFAIDVAEDYWAETQDYWAAVRDEWTRLENENDAFGLTIQGEPEELYMKLLELAGEVEDGERETADAVEEAKSIIADYTTTDIGTLADRLRVEVKLSQK